MSDGPISSPGAKEIHRLRWPVQKPAENWGSRRVCWRLSVHLKNQFLLGATVRVIIIIVMIIIVVILLLLIDLGSL